MRVLAQYFGYAFWLLATLLAIDLAWIALDVAHSLYGVWGYIVGIVLLPFTVVAAQIYQAYAFGIWIYLVELLILLPLLLVAGSFLIRWGRIR